MIGILSTVGLVAALVGDGWWDGLSWASLSLPVLLYFIYTIRRQATSRDKWLRHLSDAAFVKCREQCQEQMPRESRLAGKLPTHDGGEKGLSDMTLARRQTGSGFAVVRI